MALGAARPGGTGTMAFGTDLFAQRTELLCDGMGRRGSIAGLRGGIVQGVAGLAIQRGLKQVRSMAKIGQSAVLLWRSNAPRKRAELLLF